MSIGTGNMNNLGGSQGYQQQTGPSMQMKQMAQALGMQATYVPQPPERETAIGNVAKIAEEVAQRACKVEGFVQQAINSAMGPGPDTTAKQGEKVAGHYGGDMGRIEACLVVIVTSLESIEVAVARL
jgi:hypothetical protein